MNRPRDAAQGRAGSRTSARTISSAARVYHVPASEMYDEPHPNWRTVEVVRVSDFEPAPPQPPGVPSPPKPPCLYPMWDGQRCLECDACQDTIGGDSAGDINYLGHWDTCEACNGTGLLYTDAAIRLQQEAEDAAS